MIKSIKILLPGNERASLYVVGVPNSYTNEQGLQTPARITNIMVDGARVTILFSDDMGVWAETIYGCPYRTETEKLLHE